MWKNKFVVNKLLSKTIDIKKGTVLFSPSIETKGIVWKNIKCILGAANIFTHNLNSYCNIQHQINGDIIKVSLETNEKRLSRDTTSNTKFNINSNYIYLKLKVEWRIRGTGGYWDNTREKVPGVFIKINNKMIAIQDIYDKHLITYDDYYREEIDTTIVTYDIHILQVFHYQTAIDVDIAVKSGRLIGSITRNYATDKVTPMNVSQCNLLVWEDKLNNLQID